MTHFQESHEGPSEGTQNKTWQPQAAVPWMLLPGNLPVGPDMDMENYDNGNLDPG